MSYCREEGQDQIIFVTKEDDEAPISEDINLQFDEEDEPEGLIRADGSINWECPCLGNMISGPCGVEVRDFFSCFHDSSTKEGGNPSDCIGEMRSLDKCMSQYPELYPRRASRQETSEEVIASATTMELDIKNGHGENGDTVDERTEEENIDKKSS